jgi:hypothetical protein
MGMLSVNWCFRSSVALPISPTTTKPVGHSRYGDVLLRSWRRSLMHVLLDMVSPARSPATAPMPICWVTTLGSPSVTFPHQGQVRYRPCCPPTPPHRRFPLPRSGRPSPLTPPLMPLDCPNKPSIRRIELKKIRHVLDIDPYVHHKFHLH